MTKIKRIFPGGNTSEGFYSFHDNIIGENRKRLYVLKGMPGGGKSSLMKSVGKKAVEKGYSVEYHHCPSDPNSIDGIVIEELGIGIVDGTAPHIIDPIYPGLVDKLIDLTQFIDSKKLINFKDKIIKAKIDNKKAYSKAFGYFKSASIVYNIISENNKAGLDIKGVNREIKSLIDEIFSKEPVNKGGFDFKERHLFTNANTPDGYVDYTDTILRYIPNIYYIKGEIGTGKSDLIERMVEECRIRDYSIDIYHNSTLPKKLETLFIKDLKVCITSNEYGLQFPHKMIDLDKYLDKRVINEEDYEVYRLLIEKATINLSKARENHHILEETYKTAVDYNQINRIREDIIKEIFG